MILASSCVAGVWLTAPLKVRPTSPPATPCSTLMAGSAAAGAGVATEAPGATTGSARVDPSGLRGVDGTSGAMAERGVGGADVPAMRVEFGCT